jgi:hypothetical protein
MAEERSGEIEPVYLTLADILELHGLIIGATRPGLASRRGGLPGSRSRGGIFPLTRA